MFNVIHDFICNSAGKSVICYVTHKIRNSIVLLRFLTVFENFMLLQLWDTQKSISVKNFKQCRTSMYILFNGTEIPELEVTWAWQPLIVNPSVFITAVG
jgi:hypothetical protein